MELSVVDSIDDVDSQEWDRLALVRSFYMGTGWLRFGELIDPGQRALYAVVQDRGRYILAVPIFVTAKAGNVHYDTAKLFPELERGEETSLLIGGSRGYHSRLLIDDDVPRETRAQALTRFVDHIDTLIREHGARTAWWLYLDDESVRELRAYTDSAPRVLRCDCQIELPEGGYDAYLDLTGHRRQISNDEARFNRAGYELGRRKLSEIIPEAGRLLANTQRRYGFDVSVENMTRLLRIQCDATRDSATVFTCELDGDLVGYCLAYQAGQTVYGRAVGFDYERLVGASEYFTLSYYAPIRSAYQSGMTAYHLGTSAYEAKVLRGARVTPLWALPFGEMPWTEAAAAKQNTLKLEEIREILPGRHDVVRSSLWSSLTA